MKWRWKIAALTTLLASGTLLAAEEPRELSWGMLNPNFKSKLPDIKSKTFLANGRSGAATGSTSANDSNTPIPMAQLDPSDSEWMSRGTRQHDREALSAVVPELDGQRVRLGGYVVPLDFEGTQVKEFLLVPFVGACIHVPAPPPNQIVYVKTSNSFEVSQFQPVYVTGTIRTEQQLTDVVATGYSMDAESVEPRQE